MKIKIIAAVLILAVIGAGIAYIVSSEEPEPELVPFAGPGVAVAPDGLDSAMGVPAVPGADEALVSPGDAEAGQTGDGSLAEITGQPQDGEAPGKPASEIIEQKGGRPTAEQLLAGIQALYRTAETLRVEGVASIVLKHDGKKVNETGDSKFQIVFKRPNKFVVNTEDSRLSSDGKTAYSYVAAANRYVKTDMNDDVFREVITSKVGVGVLGLVAGVDYAPAVSSMKLLNDSKVGDQETYVMSLKLKKGVGCDPNVDATQKLWISKKDLSVIKNELVESAKPVVPKGYKGDVPKVVQTTTVGRVTKFSPNVKIPDSTFAFKPPKGAKPLEAPKQVNLMDKPAPDFSFKWTDGSTKKLSDFRGKLVILNFWALPDCEKQLATLQKVYETHKDSVHMITLNLNENSEDVRKVLKSEGFTFPTVYANEKIAKTVIEDYGLRAVPMMLIIDSKGTVRRVMIGMADSTEIGKKLANVKAAH